MRNVRARFIKKLVLNKDPNTLARIERQRPKVFSKMSGVSIYRHAKRLWKQFGIEDKWGQIQSK